MRDLLDEMIDGRRPTVHESAKHLRGLFTAFMRGRGKEKEDDGPAKKKRKKEDDAVTSALPGTEGAGYGVATAHSSAYGGPTSSAEGADDGT